MVFQKVGTAGGPCSPLKIIGNIMISTVFREVGNGWSLRSTSPIIQNMGITIVFWRGVEWQGYADTLIQPYSASERFYIVIYNTRKYFASKTCPNISMSLERLLTVAEWCNFIQIPVDVLIPHADCRDMRSDYRHAVLYQGFGKCFSQTCNCSGIVPFSVLWCPLDVFCFSHITT